MSSNFIAALSISYPHHHHHTEILLAAFSSLIQISKFRLIASENLEFELSLKMLRIGSRCGGGVNIGILFGIKVAVITVKF